MLTTSPSASPRIATLSSCLCFVLVACSVGSPPAAVVKPVKADSVGHESELLKLTLTPEAEQRLGLKTVALVQGTSRLVRSVQGEVVAAPISGGLPVSSAMDLGTLSAGQASADGEVARRRAELQVAERAFVRAEALVREEAGSVRARDEAESVLGVARANLATAQAQRALLGPPLADVARGDRMWVRAAMYAADLANIDSRAPAQVKSLGAVDRERSARPVDGPPTANTSAGTVDLYYALASDTEPFRLGERVAVEVPLRGNSSSLVSPASAILRDIHGGEWVYVLVAAHAYERRRVEVTSTVNGQARLARGPGAGAQVVSEGAMELFGAEFGAK